MKNHIKILFLAAAAMTAACTKTVDMENGIDQRLQKTIGGYIDALSSAEDGWIVKVPTAAGIYSFWMDFTNNNMVTMYTDNVNHPQYRNVPQTSTYNIRALLRPTISFDTYNYISIINDPNNSISFGSNNQGLETDFEFEVVDFDGDTFNLEGRINRVKATIERATHDEMLKVRDGGLMDAVSHTIGYKKGQYLCFDAGETVVQVNFRNRAAFFYYVDPADGKGKASEYMTDIRLNKDIEFWDTCEILGLTITAIRWDEASQTFSVVFDSGETTPLNVRNEAAVSLYDLLGPGKTFDTMFSVPVMYPEESYVDNELADWIYVADYYLYDSFGLELLYCAMEFYLNDAGRPRARLGFYVYDPEYGVFRETYTYQLMMNDAERTITFGTAATYESTYSALFYNYATKPMVDYFKAQTFKVEWSTRSTYYDETMGQLTLVPGPATQYPGMFYGAIY